MLYSGVQQSEAITHILFFPHIGYYRIWSRVSCVIPYFFYLFYKQQCVYVNPNLLIQHFRPCLLHVSLPFCLESGHPCWAANVCVCVFVSHSVVSDSLWPHVALQASLSMEFSRQEYWSWLPFLSAEDVPNPGIEPGSPTLRADSLPSGPPGKPIELLHWCPITSWVSPGCPRDSLTSSHPNWAYCPSLSLFAL